MDTADKNTTQEAFERIIVMLRGIQEDLQAIKNSRRVIDGERILDFSEVCDMLHMGERQVRRYREQGKLTGFLLDSRRMYWESEVRQFLKNYAGLSPADSIDSSANEL